MRYLRPGDNNPSAKLFVRKLKEAKSKEVIPPREVLNWGEYIYTDVTWATDMDFR